MSLLAIFKSHIPTPTQYVFKDGQVAVFKRRTATDSRCHFLTDDPEQIRELYEEARKGHPFIHIDPDDQEIDSTLADPQKQLEAEIEARVRAKILAELGDPNQARVGLRDMGTNEDTKPLLTPASSVDVAGTDAENNKQSENSTATMSEKLAALKAATDANKKQEDPKV